MQWKPTMCFLLLTYILKKTMHKQTNKQQKPLSPGWREASSNDLTGIQGQSTLTSNFWRAVAARSTETKPRSLSQFSKLKQLGFLTFHWMSIVLFTETYAKPISRCIIWEQIPSQYKDILEYLYIRKKEIYNSKLFLKFPVLQLMQRCENVPRTSVNKTLTWVGTFPHPLFTPDPRDSAEETVISHCCLSTSVSIRMTDVCVRPQRLGYNHNTMILSSDQLY